MNKQQFFEDICGSTASITKKADSYRLIVRDFYGKVVKRSTRISAEAAKVALCRVGGSWHTTRGFVE